MYIHISDLKGNVKIHKSFINGLIEKIMFFDDKGNLYKEDSFKDGKILESFVIENAERKIYRYHKNENSPSLEKAFFDDQGHLMEETYFNENNITEWENTYSYNDAGNIVSERREFGSVITSIDYKYDIRQNLVEKSILSSTENESFVYLFKYDQLNRQTKKIKKRGDNSIIKTQITEYLNGNQVAWKKFDANGLLVKFKIYQYNETNQLVRKIRFEKHTDSRYQSIHNEADFKEYYDLMAAFKYDINNQKNDIPVSIIFLSDDTRFEYDIFGNEILKEKFEYRADFSNQCLTLWRSEYNEYNDKNLLIKYREDETHTDWDWSTEENNIYTFDEMGRMILKETNGIRKTHFFYNENGNLAKKTTQSNGEGLEEKEEIAFDNNGNVISYYEFTDYKEGTIKETTKKYEIEYY